MESMGESEQINVVFVLIFEEKHVIRAL